jgi:hypothetical protein
LGQQYLRKKPNKILFAPFAAVRCELLPVTSSSQRPLRNLRVLCDLRFSSSSSHLKENLKPQKSQRKPTEIAKKGPKS